MKTAKYTKRFKNTGSLTNIFIPTNKKWQSTENENLSVIETGQGGFLFNKIVDDIRNAKKMICLQSFLIQDTEIIDELIKAQQERNVRIFILDSAETRLKSGFEEEESFSTKEYKKMLTNKFKCHFVHRQAGNLHSKFILIDPNTQNAKGYLLTGNFNEKPFFKNPELGVELNIEQIKEFFNIFTYHFWEHTTDEQTATKQFDKVKSVGKFEPPILTKILVTSPNKELSNLKETLINAVNKAEKHIMFSTFGFDLKNEISQIILTKLKQGVKVTVFCRPREKAIKGNIEELAKNGATVICHPLIHAKSLIVDNNKAFIFTANFEKHGMDTGFETGIILNKKQMLDLQKVYKQWKGTFPLKYYHKKSIQEISQYRKFEKDIIDVSSEKIEHLNKKIDKVQDLINVIDKIKEPSKYDEKQYIIEAVIEFESLDEYKKKNKIDDKVTEKNKKITDDITEIIFEKKIIRTNKKGKKVGEKMETYTVIVLEAEVLNNTIIDKFRSLDKSLKILKR